MLTDGREGIAVSAVRKVQGGQPRGHAVLVLPTAAWVAPCWKLKNGNCTVLSLVSLSN